MKIPDLDASQLSYLPAEKIRSLVRKAWMIWPVKHAAVQRQAKRITTEDGRKKTLIECAHCKDLFTRKQIQVNHRRPVGPLANRGSDDTEAYIIKINDYISRMFRPLAELEALCVDCHRRFTNLTH